MDGVGSDKVEKRTYLSRYFVRTSSDFASL
jgi:hypothetical protein